MATAKSIKNKVYANSADREQLLDELYGDNRAFTRKIVLAANGQYVVPAGFKIDSIVIRNTTANAITGGLRIGTAAAGADVVAAQAVGANAFLQVGDAAILKRAFSLTAVQSLFLEAVTAWNSASIEVYVKLSALLS